MDVDTTHTTGRTLVLNALVPVIVVALLCIAVVVAYTQNAADRRHADRTVCATVRDGLTDQHDLLVTYLPPDPKTTAFLDALESQIEATYEKCIARIG